MNLLVTLESMLYNNLKLEEIWAEFGNTLNIFMLVYNLFLYFTNRYTIQGNLKSLPYSSFFINIYEENLKKYNHITLAVPVGVEIYIPLITDNIKKLSKFKQIVTYQNNEELELYINEYTDSFTHSFGLVNKYHSKFMIVYNLFEYIYLLLFTKVEICRMSLFNGIGWIIWSLFSYYIPLLFMWPSAFRLNKFFNGSRTWIALGILMVHIGYARLLRTLQEIDYERYIAQNKQLEPLCGSEYIFYGSSITSATIILLSLLIFILILFIKYPLISLIISIITMAYYISMLFPFILRNIVMVLAIFASHILLQYKWFWSVFLQ